MYLKVVLSIELEGIFFEDKAKHFSEVMCRYGRVLFVKFAVCFHTGRELCGLSTLATPSINIYISEPAATGECQYFLYFVS